MHYCQACLVSRHEPLLDLTSSPLLRLLPPADVARQLEWVGGVEAEQAALAEDIQRLEAQIEALKTSTAAPASPSTLPGGGGGLDPVGGEQSAAPFLLVAVLSVAGNRERRDAIRSTWKASAPPVVRVRVPGSWSAPLS